MYKAEIRFGKDKDWFLIDPIKRSQGIAQSNHLQFTSSNLNEILNRGLRGIEISDYPAEMQSTEMISSSENSDEQGNVRRFNLVFENEI
ncbi:hypothetical protein LEP1GSC085_2341 [Leptospira interrogans str. L0996]|nr:hypothetical protein LEP1GSC085_2341 [Leptospira interrogans str. L0996]